MSGQDYWHADIESLGLVIVMLSGKGGGGAKGQPALSAQADPSRNCLLLCDFMLAKGPLNLKILPLCPHNGFYLANLV